jgi:hypothetical protein
VCLTCQVPSLREIPQTVHVREHIFIRRNMKAGCTMKQKLPRLSSVSMDIQVARCWCGERGGGSRNLTPMGYGLWRGRGRKQHTIRKRRRELPHRAVSSASRESRRRLGPRLSGHRTPLPPSLPPNKKKGDRRRLLLLLGQEHAAKMACLMSRPT